MSAVTTLNLTTGMSFVPLLSEISRNPNVLRSVAVRASLYFPAWSCVSVAEPLGATGDAAGISGAAKQLEQYRDDPEAMKSMRMVDALSAAPGLAVLPFLGGAAMRGARTAAGRAARRAERKAALVAEDAAAARPTYERATDGDTFTVRRAGVAPEIRTAPEALNTTSLSGLRAIAQDPERSNVMAVANDAAMAARGAPFDLSAPQPVSSLARQGGIARAFDEAASGNPDYKHALFERYGEMMPEVVERAGAQNYDQLTEAAYRQLGDEVTQQFDKLPLSFRYHQGSHEYASPNDMLQDVLGRGNMNVFSGGDPHEFLSRVDPATGLSQNEMFRGVHDYIGHAVPGSNFNAPGEEIAYAAHAQTLSPLARMALLSETRGQNSWGNYGPANVDVIDAMNRLRMQRKERGVAERWIAQYPNDRNTPEAIAALGRLPDNDEISRRLKELGSQFQFADQRAVLLPPEYLDPMPGGGVPDWLRPILPTRASTNDVRGVHFSTQEGLTGTDPSFYGTGAFSGEKQMVRREGLPNRAYMYSGPEGTVVPEAPVAAKAKAVYEANLGNLYDVNADPEKLLALSRAYNLGDYKPEVPEQLAYLGGIEGSSALPDMERLIRDYNYSGFLTDMGGQRAAAIYDPVTGLRRIEKGLSGYAEGGRVDKPFAVRKAR